MAATAEALIITLIGEQWAESVIFLQLLCFVGIFYPLKALTRNILFVYGKSGLVLRLGIFTKTLAVPAILVGIFFGIKYMIIAMIVTGLIEFLAKSYYSGKFLGYPVSQQLKDLKTTLFLAVGVGALLFLIALFLQIPPFYMLVLQLAVGVVFTIGLSELFRLKEYLYIKEVTIEQFKDFVRHRRK